jgi:hypothetical protein
MSSGILLQVPEPAANTWSKEPWPCERRTSRFRTCCGCELCKGVAGELVFDEYVLSQAPSAMGVSMGEVVRLAREGALEVRGEYVRPAADYLALVERSTYGDDRVRIT